MDHGGIAAQFLGEPPALGEARLRRGVAGRQAHFCGAKKKACFRKAQRLFEKAVRHNPKSAMAANALGGIIIEIGKIEQSIKHIEEGRNILKRSIALGPTGWRWYNLGLTYDFERRLWDMNPDEKRASLECERKCYVKSVAVDSSNWLPYYNLAHVCAELRRNADAVEALSSSLRIGSQETLNELTKVPDRQVFETLIKDLQTGSPNNYARVEEMWASYGKPW